jgi:3-hydroxymyristoyl/3-hydroxydecanoyl-(acyl carrier protein) dehydratase
MTAPGGETAHLEIEAHVRRDEGDIEIHEFESFVPADLRWFQGHFTGNPVLPAVVQVREALRLVAAVWPDLEGLRRITRAKFQRPIRPSDVLHMYLTRVRGTSKAAFEFRRQGDTCSSGTLEFEREREPQR